MSAPRSPGGDGAARRTFHPGRHELHGVTVVVNTQGSEVIIGRCDDLDEQRVVLLDAEVHRDGEGGRSNSEYIERAARLGVWPKHARLVVPRDRVVSIRRLGGL